MRILLIEDNERLVRALEQGFSEEGIAVVPALAAAKALEQSRASSLDAIVLDLGLPDMDGMTLLQLLRTERPHIPLLVLTARDAVESRVAALDAGADDYLIKPFEFAELLARLRALTRRAGGPRWAAVEEGEVALDDEFGVRHGDVRVVLTPREHALLAYLLRRRFEVVPRIDILREVFGYSHDPGTNAIDVHLAHLRRKLTGLPIALETVRGAGFRARVTDA
ncbi:response regulator transcription factor [Nannocystis sp. ILAH1]|uniref:response regulator transcription factor n=1 Tax=unclassified Nannocystis TaxID=2627009 RepID=UPI0022718448|nr:MULTISPECIES: response regulator transcription factor [unclassified Nannocystis]MCY0995064.1 response regulator transcription factor [Nannocystis sp. ILAH1]MCY1069738.1 response regulator transcription factor [Nannocystis sp. RBIL2]